MNTFGNSKSKINPRNILGGILGGYEYEEDYERETSIASSVTYIAGGLSEAISGLVQETTQTEPEKKSNENGRFPLTGSIEDFQKQKVETDRKKAFSQALKEGQIQAQRSKEEILQKEVDNMIASLPTEQKNKLLHYQASYKDKSIYQIAELRKKVIEQQQQAKKQEKAASIPSPAKQPSAMEGAFEGRSGNQGGGTANLSAQAVG